MAAVQTRIEQIQTQLATLTPPAPAPAGFALPPTPPSGGADAVTAGSGDAGRGGPVTASLGPGSVGLAPADGVPGSGRPAADGPDAARLAQQLPPAGRPFAGAIVRAAQKAGIDPTLLASLVQHESGFDPAARSHAGAIGLGQLMPGTAAGLGVDPTDPQQNLDGAARYLRDQLDRFGSADLALAAYNAGPGRVAQAGGIPQITETRTYVQRVLTTWEQYR